MTDKYILDTNLFFNLETGLKLGNKTQDVVVEFTKIANKVIKKNQVTFFMPPRVVDEFMSFFPNQNQAFIKDFLAVISIKSPKITDIDFSATVFYQLIENIRQRSYQGLNLAEEEIIKAGHLFNGKKIDSKKDFEITLGPVIKNFRDRYRKATRFGFLDSLADLDLIVLAKEQDGFLLSADEGVIAWGRLFGIKEISAEVWQKKMAAL